VQWPSSGQNALGRELLAAVAAALVDDGTTVLGGHTGTETVTAGTHELGRLVCTLHDIKPRRARFLLLALHKQEFQTHAERQAPTVRVGGVYREKPGTSQRACTHFLGRLPPLFSRPYHRLNQTSNPPGRRR